MDQHVTFTKAECGFCELALHTDSGFCPIPTCGLTVHLFTAVGGSDYPVLIGPECDRAHATELVVAIVKAAAHKVADRHLEVRLAARTADEFAVNEEAQTEHSVSEDEYEIKFYNGGTTICTTAEIAEEVRRRLADLQIEHFFDQEIRTLAK